MAELEPPRGPSLLDSMPNLVQALGTLAGPVDLACPVMAVIENAAWQQAADHLHAALVCVLETAPGSAITEVDWAFDYEDWLRDAVESVASYARWRLSGEHRFQYLRPEYGMGPVLADTMALATSTFLPLPSYPGWRLTHPDWQIPDDRLADLRAATNAYRAVRPPNAGGLFGFERYMGAAQPRDSVMPQHRGADIVEGLR
jgi:hypothetical protein